MREAWNINDSEFLEKTRLISFGIRVGELLFSFASTEKLGAAKMTIFLFDAPDNIYRTRSSSESLNKFQSGVGKAVVFSCRASRQRTYSSVSAVSWNLLSFFRDENRLRSALTAAS